MSSGCVGGSMGGSTMSGTVTAEQPAGSWNGTRLAERLLAGDGVEDCLSFGRTVRRDELRGLVAEQVSALRAAGLTAGGVVALRLPPSLAFVAALLAGWTLDAQTVLLDHRLTDAETDRALERVGAQVVVSGVDVRAGKLRGYAEATAVAALRPGGRPAG